MGQFSVKDLHGAGANLEGIHSNVVGEHHATTGTKPQPTGGAMRTPSPKKESPDWTEGRKTMTPGKSPSVSGGGGGTQYAAGKGYFGPHGAGTELQKSGNDLDQYAADHAVSTSNMAKPKEPDGDEY